MDRLHQITWCFLCDGLGVEDMAVMTGEPVDRFRACVRHFRAQGKLPALYGRAKKDWHQA